MSSLVSVLVGSATTLLGGLGGVMLTNKLSARRADRDRARQERKDQRDHVVEVIEAGRDWVHNFTSMSIAYAASGSMQKAIEAAPSASQIATRERYHRALIAADLLLIDATLHEQSRELLRHFDDSTKVIEPLALAALHNKRGTQSEVNRAIAHADQHGELLDSFAEESRARLVKLS